MKKSIFLIFMIIFLVSIVGCEKDVEEIEYCPDYEGDIGLESCETIVSEIEEIELEVVENNKSFVPDNEMLEEEIKIRNLTLPIVAIHVSEYSRKDWKKVDDWYIKGINYFEQYTALEEILNSHKIPFIKITDAEIEKGILMLDKHTVRYPILFSLNNQVLSSKEAEEIKNYVDKGGHVFFNYFSFTEKEDPPNPDKDCFILKEVGLRCVFEPSINRIPLDLVEKKKNHPIVEHIPQGELAWRMSLYRLFQYDNFIVEAVNKSDELISGKLESTAWFIEDPIKKKTIRVRHVSNITEGANTVITQYGKGAFIYNSQINLLWGRYQGEPAIYNALIALKSIEWAFDRLKTPLIRMKPWKEYDAAFMLRFDVEPDYETFLDLFPKFVDIVTSEREKGVFYILVNQKVKGPPSPDFEPYNVEHPNIADLLRYARSKGMIIGSHSTWHVGPDFDGEEALENINNSLNVLEKILGERPDEWVAPAFGANFDHSFRILEKLSIKTTGDQKFGYLPHFALSPDKEGFNYPILEIPTSDFFHQDYLDGGSPQTILEHHTERSIEELVDFYYDLGAIINLYAHLKPGNDEKLFYLIKYVKKKSNVWHTYPDELYDYWMKRSNLDYNLVSFMNNTLVLEIENMIDKFNSGILRISIPQGYKISEIKGDGKHIDNEDKSFVDISFKIKAKGVSRISIVFDEI